MVNIIIEVMTTAPSDKAGRLLFWQHLHYLFVHLLIYQFIKIGDVMRLLRKELSSESTNRELVKSNRDMLMWLLLQYISGNFETFFTSSISPFFLILVIFNGNFFSKVS